MVAVEGRIAQSPKETMLRVESVGEERIRWERGEMRGKTVSVLPADEPHIQCGEKRYKLRSGQDHYPFGTLRKSEGFNCAMIGLKPKVVVQWRPVHWSSRLILRPSPDLASRRLTERTLRK